MMQSLAMLNAAQTARLMTLPDQANAPVPLREALLELPRERNAAVDAFFYDLGTLTNHEAAALAPRYAAPGAVLLVQNSDHADTQLYADFDAFRASRQSQAARALVVAGGGGSALGAAAFARNVADALDAPVLAVVAGYGLADLMTEAMGGMLWFAQATPIRSFFDMFDAMTRPHHSTFAYSRAPKLDKAHASFDVKTVAAMLASGEIDTVIGHSRGNLVIAAALALLEELHPKIAAGLRGKLRVVQVSTRVPLPEGFTAPITIMGEQDQFGEMNSDKGMAVDFMIPGGGHHTNTEVPGHLFVTNAVADAMKKPRSPAKADAA